MSDDCDAPHEWELCVEGMSLRSFTDHMLRTFYLPTIAGGRATWILQTDRRAGRPLAVLTQQWPQPRFLVNADVDLFTYVTPDAKPHLFLRYSGQVEPESAVDCLQRGEALPDMYGR